MKLDDVIRKLKRKLVKETFWSVLSKAIAMVLFLATNILLTRFLGVEGFGSWSFFLSIVTTLSLISYFGINASTKKYVAQHRETKRINEIFVDSVKIRVFASIIFVFLLLLSHLVLRNFIVDEGFIKLLLAAIPLLFFNGLLEYTKGFFIGLHRIKYNFYINLIDFGLKFFLVLTILPIAGDVIYVLWSYTFAVVVAASFGFYVLLKKFICIEGVNKNIFKKRVLSYSFPMFVISIGFLVATELDTIMIGILRDDYEVGIYSAAKQIIAKAPQISIAFSMGIMPIFSKLNSENVKSLKRVFDKATKLNLILFVFIGLFIVLFSDYFIPLLLGEEYRDSVLVIKLLTPYLIIYAATVYYSGFLNYRGLAKKRAKNLLWSLLLNILLNVILIPRYGATGAAISTSISFLPHLVLNWMQTKKEFEKFDNG